VQRSSLAPHKPARRRPQICARTRTGGRCHALSCPSPLPLAPPHSPPSCEALRFLSNDAKLLHGNVSPDAVWVTRGGSWKLAGLECAAPLSAAGAPLDAGWTAADAAGACPELYRSPERAARDWGSVALARGGGACLDAYSAGVLVCEVFSRAPLRAAAELRAAASSAVPSALRGAVAALLAASPRARPADYAGELVGSDYFRHPLVGTMVFLDALALKEPAEKQRFFRSLPALLPRVPDAIAKYRMLPALLHALEYGAAGGGGTVVLAPILEIGGRLADGEYAREIIPVLVRLFSSPDRATRIQLLHHLPAYVERIAGEALNRDVFPQLLNGFTDTNAVLREATVKSSLHLAPALSDANRHGVLLRHLKRTAADAEPAIRVNTIICCGRIAHCVSDRAAREDLLAAVFLRALRDPFPAARTTALRAIAFCVALPPAGAGAAGAAAAGGGGGGGASAAAAAAPPAATAADAGYWGVEMLAKKVLHAALLMMLDANGETRDAAAALLDAGSRVLRAHSESLWVQERAAAAASEAAAASAAAGGGGGGGGGGGEGGDKSARAGAAPAAANSAARVAAGAMAGALSWAVSSLASRIIPSGNIDEDGSVSPPAAAAAAAAAAAPAAAPAARQVQPRSAAAGAAPAPAAMRLASSGGGSSSSSSGWGDDDLFAALDETASPPRAQARAGAAGARAAAAASAATAAAAEQSSGWDDAAWGSLLGDEASESAAPVAAAAMRARPAAPRAFVLSAGDDEDGSGAPSPPRAGAARAAVRSAPAAAAAAAAAAATAAPAAGGGMRLAAAKKVSLSGGKGGGGSWDDF